MAPGFNPGSQVDLEMMGSVHPGCEECKRLWANYREAMRALRSTTLAEMKKAQNRVEEAIQDMRLHGEAGHAQTAGVSPK